MNVDSESETSTGIHEMNRVRAIGALSSLCARPLTPEAEVEVSRLNREPGRSRAHFGEARTESSMPRGFGGEGRKLESHGSRSEPCAFAVPVTVACPYFCRDPISSPATSLGTGNVRGGVRDSMRHIGHREQHVSYRHADADKDNGAHLDIRQISRDDPFASAGIWLEL